MLGGSFILNARDFIAVELTMSRCDELQEIAKRLEVQLGEQREINRELLATVKMWEKKRDIWIDERRALNEEAYRHNGLRMSAIAQRDELLAACKAQLEAHTPYMIRKAAADARAAITKTEQL